MAAQQPEQARGDGRPPYPAGVPSKFAPSGAVQPFPGNTILIHLAASDPVFASLESLGAALASSRFSSSVALLPPSSYHMTVFEGVCDQVRQPGYWPADLPLDTPLQECTSHLEEKLSGLRLRDGDAPRPPPYDMAIAGFDPLDVGISLRLEGRAPSVTERLRGLRGRLAAALQIRHPIHDEYGFHISVAYLLRHLDDAEKRELEALLSAFFTGMPKTLALGAPEFCVFGDMFAFERRFHLGSIEEASASQT
ncbi:hypothetical protein EsH8_VIII_000211 [Colletotrichum jinshuiense]